MSNNVIVCIHKNHQLLVAQYNAKKITNECSQFDILFNSKSI